MRQGAGQIPIRHLGDVGRQPIADLGDHLRGFISWGGDPIQPPFAFTHPTVDPVADVQSPIGAELNVRGQNFPYRPAVFYDAEERPLRRVANRTNPALVGRPSEVGQQESITEAVTESSTGIEVQSRGTVGDIRDRRNDVGRLLRMPGFPQTLAVEGAAVGKVLVGHPPAAVAALEHIHPPGPIATVGIVVSRKKISVIVERQFLRIAQACGKNLQIRAIEFTAEHGPRFHVDQSPVPDGDVGPPIADAEIQPPVGPDGQTMQIVSTKCDADAEARMENRFAVGSVIAVFIAHQVQIGDARVVHVAFVFQDACPCSIDQVIEVIREHMGSVRLAVAVLVDQQTDAVIVLVEFGDRVLVQQFTMVFSPVLDRLGGQIPVDPSGIVTAVVDDSRALAEGFANIDLSRVRHPKGDWIGQVGLGREQIDLESFLQSESLHCQPGLIGRCRDFRRFRFRDLLGDRPTGAGDSNRQGSHSPMGTASWSVDRSARRSETLGDEGKNTHRS